MKNEMEVIKALEKRLKEEDENITLGDTEETTILKQLDAADMSLPNIIIGLYNMVKINQYKIKRLESNLLDLAERVYDTDTDFAQEEIEEIDEALSDSDLEMLNNIKRNKEYIMDFLWCTESDYDTMFEKQKRLMNKIQYPTAKMNKTFNDLLKKYIKFRNEVNA